MACGDGGGENRKCTLELRSAVSVDVQSPEGLSVDEVTVENVGEERCEGEPGLPDGGDSPDFVCMEQAGGTYVVRVRSGTLTWTREVDLPFDGCHVTRGETMTVVLTSDGSQ